MRSYAADDRPIPLTQQQSDFLEQATIELYRIKEKRHHQMQLLSLQDQLDDLRQTIHEKDAVIELLTRALTEKERQLQVNTPHYELVRNWAMMEQLVQMKANAGNLMLNNPASIPPITPTTFSTAPSPILANQNMFNILNMLGTTVSNATPPNRFAAPTVVSSAGYSSAKQ
jgi:hypothetical protein